MFPIKSLRAIASNDLVRELRLSINPRWTRSHGLSTAVTVSVQRALKPRDVYSCHNVQAEGTQATGCLQLSQRPCKGHSSHGLSRSHPRVSCLAIVLYNEDVQAACHQHEVLLISGAVRGNALASAVRGQKRLPI